MNKDANNIRKSAKSGLVTIIGRSNAGKSTLLNTLVGTKIAIVTHLPQTTRDIIHGVLNRPEGQAVFVDTPGVFKEIKSRLSGKLTSRIQEAMKGIDLIIYVVDPTKSVGAEERHILSLMRKATVPKILVINKSDLPQKEKLYIEDYRAMAENFSAVFELSAMMNRHVEPLRDKVFELLPEGEPFYPPEQITNVDPKFWVAEIVREKIFLALRKEVPYTTHVEVMNIEDREDLTYIEAIIYTNDSRYKKMIIGAGGRALKEIGIAARKELETALGKKIFLDLNVETDRHWDQRI